MAVYISGFQTGTWVSGSNSYVPGSGGAFETASTNYVTTWSPTYKDPSITLSNGNLTATSTLAATRIARGTGPYSGTGTSFYFELTVDLSGGTSGATIEFGIANGSAPLGTFLGQDGTNSIGYGSSGNLQGTGGGTNGLISTGNPTYTTGDIMGVALTSSDVKLYKNGTLIITRSVLPAGILYPAVSFGKLNEQFTANFGATAFSFLPSGSVAWNATASTGINAVVAQTLGALSQAAAITLLDAATVSQTLGALAQATTGTVAGTAAITQNLAALTQTATAATGPSLTAAQTLGAIVQTATAGAVDATTAAQALGTLGQSVAGTVAVNATTAQTLGGLVQAASASGTSGFNAAQTLGSLVQALTGTVVSHATITQALGGLGQTTTGGPVARIGAYTDALGPLGQVSAAGGVPRANVAQVLGALAQVATANHPLQSFTAGQILGALQQVASSTHPDSALAAQVLGTLSQSARIGAIPTTEKAIKGSFGRRAIVFGNFDQSRAA
jgi:hypothetical protein